PGPSGSASREPVPASNLPAPNAQTFEELEIPASYRAAVEKELTSGEEMLWVGRPSRNREVHPRNAILPIAGGALIGLAVVIALVTLVLSIGKPSQGMGNVFPFVFAGFLGVLGLVFMLPLVVNPAKACRYCYVVTNRRAMLVEISVWQRGPVVRNYLP